MKYLITEKESLNSHREGKIYEGTLLQAKRHATKNKCFFKTILTIEDSCGVVASKEDGGVWKIT